MRAPLLVLAALLAAGSGLAASQTAQDGECAYLGDWRASATSAVSPGLRFGPPLYPYADVGACASAFAERAADGRTRLVLRADVADAPASYVVSYGQGGFEGTFACGTTPWCEVGPLESLHRPAPACGTITVWRDGAPVRSASACA